MSQIITIPNDIGCRLWIDRVGTYLVWFSSKLIIGNAFDQETGTAKLGLMANLKTEHLEIERNGESYSLHPFGSTSIEHQAITERQILRDNTHFQLGEDVELLFKIPSLLSCSATIDFVSHHRPKERTDRVILFDKTCVLDNSQHAHVTCPEMNVPVVLFERDSQLWAKSQSEFDVTTDRTCQRTTQTSVYHGTLLTGDKWQFRVEAI